MSIFKKLFLAFIFLAIVPLLLYTTISSYILLDENIDFNREIATEQLENIDSQVLSLLNTVEDEVMTLSENMLLQYENDEDFTNFIGADPETFVYDIGEEEQAIIDLLNSYRLNHSYINSVYFGTTSGAFVRSHPRASATDYDPRERIWYQIAVLDPNEVQLTDPYQSVTTTDINLGTVKAVLDDGDNIIGVVGVDITLHELASLTTDFEDYDHPYNIIVSDQNIILSHPDSSLLFEDASELEFSLPTEEMPTDQLYKVDENGVSKTIYMHHSTETGWYFYKIIPSSTLRHEANQLLIYSLLLMGLLTVLVVISTAKVSRSFTNRITTISTTMETVGKGELSLRVEDKWNDELSIISSEFNNMLGRINEAHYQIKYEDSETQLPNHVKLHEILNMKKHQGYLIQVTISNLYLLKQIYGNDQTTKLVQHISGLLKTLLNEESILARSSTTDFIYLFENITDKRKVSKIANSLKKLLSQEFLMDDLQVFLNYKLGCISLDNINLTASELLVNLNLTTMSHNLAESNIQHYDIEKRDALLHDLKIQKEMNRALDRKEFYPVFQPIMDVNTREIVGFEILARWKNKELGNVYPDIFIPIAEKNKTIISLGNYILESALEFANRYNNLYNKQILISVNCSIIQLQNEDMYKTIERLIKRYDYNPKNLILEITETVVYDAKGELSTLLADLKKLGIQIALDDFGTGYSSIQNLLLLPIDFLKIDKSLLWHSLKNEKGSAMVKTILEYTKNTGIKVIVEGVEDKSMEDKVREYQASYAQGYYYARPQTSIEILKEDK